MNCPFLSVRVALCILGIIILGVILSHVSQSILCVMTLLVVFLPLHKCLIAV